MARNKLQFRGITYDRLSAGSVHLARSPLPETLEVSTFSVTVETESQIFLDFVLDEPVIYFFRSRQMGIYYLQSVQQVSPNKYSLYATDAVGLLTKRAHRGGIYTGQTVEEICPDLFGPIPYRIKTNLSQIKLYGWLPYVKPPDASARDNLLQILFAIGAIVKVDREGVIRIEGLWDGIISTAGQNRMGQGASVIRDAKVTSVSVTEHQYAPGTESVELFEGTAQQGDEIRFDEPVHSLAAEGFTILEGGANYAILSSGTGILTGTAYRHNTRIVTRMVHEAQTENSKSFDDKTLVSIANSDAVAQRLVNYYSCHDRIQASLVYQEEIPGDRLSIYHPYNKKMIDACLESADITMSNKLKGDENLLVGFVPIKFEESNYYDYREVLTGIGQWIVPDGVTSVGYVLFSGAQGGKAGLKGGDSGGSKTHTYQTKSSLTGEIRSTGVVTVWAGPGGVGGNGGIGGKGSKILQGNLSVTPGQAISYACGIGGLGADYNADAQLDGNDGTATTFGPASSDSGSYPPDSGWTDPVTQETFATSGLTGLPGGNGAGAVDGYMIPTNSSNLNEILVYQPSTAAVDENGALWPGAPTKEKSGQDNVAYWQTYDTNNVGNCGSWAGYKLGPGGVAGVTQPEPNERGTNVPRYSNAADGLTPPAPSAIPAKPGLTCGGKGGYGGGGASCASWAGAEKTPDFPNIVEAFAGKPGTGGPGGKGGPGGDGMIILYYQQPKAVQNGPIKDRNGTVLLDELGRLVVV